MFGRLLTGGGLFLMLAGRRRCCTDSSEERSDLTGDDLRVLTDSEEE